MPLYHGQLTSISLEETKRYAGLLKNKNFPNELIEDACFEAQILAEPQGRYEVFEYEKLEETTKILAPCPIHLTSKSIINHLRHSQKVALLAVTIGETIELKITELFTKGNYTAGLLLDAAATTAVETIADQINEQIKNLATKEGYATTWRFSPGYGDWNINIQKDLLTALEAKSIGLTTTESLMLMPRKSVTAAIGFIPRIGTSITSKPGCASCPNTTCLARKELPL